QGEREASPTAAIIDSQSVKSAEKGGPASIRMAMMRQKDQGQEAPYSRRYAGFAAARDCSSGRYPRPRRRYSASCDTVRDVSVLEKAVCRRRLSGTGIPEGLGENPPLSRNRNRQALRSRQRICSAFTPQDRPTERCAAQPLPTARKGLGKPKSQGAGVLASRINPPHAPKTL